MSVNGMSLASAVFRFERDSECGQPTPEYANALQEALVNSDRCLTLYCAVTVFIAWSVAVAVAVTRSVAALNGCQPGALRQAKRTGTPNGKNDDYKQSCEHVLKDKAYRALIAGCH